MHQFHFVMKNGVLGGALPRELSVYDAGIIAVNPVTSGRILNVNCRKPRCMSAFSSTVILSAIRIELILVCLSSGINYTSEPDKPGSSQLRVILETPSQGVVDGLQVQVRLGFLGNSSTAWGRATPGGRIKSKKLKIMKF